MGNQTVQKGKASNVCHAGPYLSYQIFNGKPNRSEGQSQQRLPCRTISLIPDFQWETKPFRRAKPATFAMQDHISHTRFSMGNQTVQKGKASNVCHAGPYLSYQ